MADDEAGTAAGSVERTAKMDIMRKINVETEETNLVLSTRWRVEIGGCWAVRALPRCVRPSGRPLLSIPLRISTQYAMHMLF